MKIGILSDSHKKIGKQKKAIDFFKSQGVEFLIHSGDLVKEENLKALDDSGIKYIAIFGNNDKKLQQVSDKYNIYQEPYYFKLDGLKFKLMHHPFYMTPDSDIIIFGHTHIHEVQFINKTLFINSGEVCARDKNISEIVILDTSDKEYIVDYFYRINGSDKWNKISKKFKIN